MKGCSIEWLDRFIVGGIAVIDCLNIELNQRLRLLILNRLTFRLPNLPANGSTPQIPLYSRKLFF